MPFGFGVSGSVENKNTDSTFNSTKTPIVPEWASSLTQNTASRVGDLLNLDPNSLVAPAQPLQNQAGVGAANLSGSPWVYDGAVDLTRGAANTSWLDGYMQMPALYASGGKASDYVGNYLNPYLQSVVDSTSADLDAHDGQVRAQQALDLAGSGAFGGSGAALTQSMTEGELERARATSLSGLRSQAYNTALSAAVADADRATQARIANSQTNLQDRAQTVGFGLSGQQQQLQVGAQLGNLAATHDADLRGNIGTQTAVGDDLRNVDQAQRQAPVTSTQQIVAMLNGLPISLFVGENENGTKSENTTDTKLGGSFGLNGTFG
jgi:hypothetical protein